MKNILLPTDFSDNAWNAINFALDYFTDDRCNFFLLHVNRLGDVAISDSGYIFTQQEIEDTYLKPAKRELRTTLKRILKKFPERKNHNFYTLTDYNFFVESIKKHIESKHIDLVVMGTKGATGLKKLIVGSNTADVIKKVQCSTLVVPENAKYSEIKEVAFPTDFLASFNYKMLDQISQILEESLASLRIIHVKKSEAQLNNEQIENKELLEEFFSDHPVSFHYLSNNKLEDAIQCFVESRGIDLIVMVAKHLNYFQQILFHTKVENISYHTDIPFLVLHE